MNLGSNNNNERKQFAFDLNVKPVEDDNSDLPENLDSCTICLEPLVNAQDDRRTLVTLICGHKFHLDCIGSAFNAKGFMQCPNCKQIEPGQWRYAANPPIQNIREGTEWIAVEEADDANSGWLPQSSVAATFGRSFNNDMITGIGQVQERAPPSDHLIFPRVLEPAVMTGSNHLPHSSFHRTPSVGNAPLLLPLPIPTTRQVNRIPSLFGGLSTAPVSGRHIFWSGREQAAGISHSWSSTVTYHVRPSLLLSSSPVRGTSVNDGDGIGVNSSNGGRGGDGDRNGICGGSHLSGCRPS
ncbi:hypothetical protein N665_0062s0110 [Sinapis alba]|nr:hypothetical protein N665_0062s0110 [Sinapis alba]